MKRERDRLSSRFESLSQECNDARESAAVREQQMQSDCDTKLDQMLIQNTRAKGDLATCKNNLMTALAESTSCSKEVGVATLDSAHM